MNTSSRGFDCENGFFTWETTWSTKKKAWCCEHHVRGCKPTTSFALVRSFRTTLKAPGPLYDCAAGFLNWAKGWSTRKKSWCCEHDQVACAETVRTRGTAQDLSAVQWSTRPVEK